MYKLSVDGKFLEQSQLSLVDACKWAKIALSSGATVVKIWYNDTLVTSLEK